jgi:hypothetical protein
MEREKDRYTGRYCCIDLNILSLTPMSHFPTRVEKEEKENTNDMALYKFESLGISGSWNQIEFLVVTRGGLE